MWDVICLHPMLFSSRTEYLIPTKQVSATWWPRALKACIADSLGELVLCCLLGLREVAIIRFGFGRFRGQ